MGNTNNKNFSHKLQSNASRKHRLPNLRFSQWSLSNIADSLSIRSFVSRTSQHTNYTNSRPWSRVSRRRWQDSTLNNPWESAKTAWPVSQIEALFLPEFKIQGDVSEKNFEVVESLKKGAFGNVFRVRKIDTGTEYAMKILLKSKIVAEAGICQVKDEVRIQTMCGHNPFIVGCIFNWQNKKQLFIVSTFMNGGEMFDLLHSYGVLPEEVAKLYIAEIALAIDFLHNAGVIYRDLKLENILLDNEGHAQLIDFGLSKWLKYGCRTNTICGTLQYMAPEILENFHPYGHSVDWWSLGVVACLLLTGKVEALIGNSDFYECIKSNATFVDKSMLIKDFLYDDPYLTQVKIITAPTKFGKSTMIDMVKRFVGITVNSNGTQITPSMTENYKLFCDNKLNICKHETIVSNHLGQYPVIHINYHPLEKVKDFDTLLEQLQLVVLDTFKEHTYLSQNSTLFFAASHKDFFIKHYSSIGVKTLTKNDIQRSFGWLSQLLFKHFGKKAIVLLDEYDAYCNKLLFEKTHDVENIITFLEGISKAFFKINDYLEKALLTGVLLVKGMGVSPTGERVRNYRFLGDHKFSHYYGFTQEEVAELLRRNIHDERIRRETEEVLKNYYDGYQIQNQHTRLYSMWSVLKFIESNMKLTSFWGNDSSIKGVANLIFKNKKIKSEIKRLIILPEGHLSGDISEPLNRMDIMNLKQMKVVQDMKLGHLAVLLFDFGYLTIIHGFLQTKFLTPLKIPNMEIYVELCRLLTKNYVVKYSCKVCYIQTLFNAVDSFRFNQSNVKVYESFYQTTNDLITNSKYYPQSENDIQSFIFLILAAEFPVQKISTTKLCTNYIYNYSSINNIPTSLKQRAMDILENIMTANKTNKVARRMDIIVGNTHKMVIVISIKFQKHKPKQTKYPLDDLAKDILIKLLLKTYDPYFNQKPLIKFNKSKIYAKGRIYIGIAYDKESRNISMAFYYLSFDKEPSFINFYGVNSGH